MMCGVKQTFTLLHLVIVIIFVGEAPARSNV
jgi:hypothetical protein